MLSPTAPVALHEHAVAKPDRGAIDGVHRGNQAAAAADVVLGRDASGSIAATTPGSR